jgi:niacin transporter
VNGSIEGGGTAVKNRLFLKKAGMVAVLIAVGIIIPVFSPVKLVLEPASFTLAVHVPVFIAMLISPLAVAAVVAGTSLGFVAGGYAPVIVARAVTHILFALAGYLYLRYNTRVLSSFLKSQLFSFVIGLIHAGVEVAAVSFFYFNGEVNGVYYTTGGLLLLVGLGSLVHSLVDFGIALAVLRPLTAHKSLRTVFITSEIFRSC